jgi:hypothetical protein
MTENVRVAIISASAAVFGALAGGGATYLATVQANKSEDQRQERRLDQETRGIARELMTEFGRAATIMGAMQDAGRFYRISGTPFDLRTSPEDRQRVYAELTPDQFRRVAGAIDVGHSFTTFTKGFKDEAKLDQSLADLVATAHGAYEDAGEALVEASGLEKPVFERQTPPLPHGG